MNARINAAVFHGGFEGVFPFRDPGIDHSGIQVRRAQQIRSIRRSYWDVELSLPEEETPASDGVPAMAALKVRQPH